MAGVLGEQCRGMAVGHVAMIVSGGRGAGGGCGYGGAWGCTCFEADWRWKGTKEGGGLKVLQRVGAG